MTLPAAPPATDSLADWALWWAACGVPVLPLHPREKAPYISRDKVTGKAWAGYLSATTDPEIIARWWETYPGSNIGGEMSERSGLLALDVDPRSGGRDSLAQICRGYGDLPASVKQITGRGDGGFHLIMRRPEGVTDFYGELAPGLELKTKGYIVLSPSVHPDTGQRYVLAPDCAPHEVTYAAPPDWMVPMMVKPASVTAPIVIPEGGYAPDDRYASAAMRAEVEALAATRDNRNVRLNRAAYCLGQFVAAGRLARATVFNALWVACEANGLLTDPDDGPDKTRSTINRGLDDGAKEPRTTAAVPASTPEAETPPHPAEAEAPVSPDRSVPIQFPAADRGWSDLMSWREPRPKSILGDGLLRARQIGMIHGRDGSRKSWVMLHLALCAAAGRPFFGIEIEEPLRVGLVSLEDDYWTLHDRASSVAAREDLDPGLLTANFRLIAPPIFDLPIDILSPSHVAVLAAWTLQHHLDLLLIDHLTRFHALDDERELGQVSAAMIQFARDCTVGLLANHHDRKSAAGAKGRDSQAARGDSRFVADCRLVIHTVEAGDRIRLEVEKSTGARKPDVIWLKHCDEFGGALQITTAPKAAGEKKASNLDALVALVEAAGPAGVSPGSINAKATLGISPATMGRYARQLEDEGALIRTGKTDTLRWISPRCLHSTETLSEE